LGIERRRLGLFAELFAFLVGYHREMEIVWLGIAELLLQPVLSGRRIEQIGSANYVGDALRCVVYYHRQLVGEVAIGPADCEILDFRFRKGAPRDRTLRLERAALS
jgi:hypothetical protein